ncbi:MAG: hypothetical protein WBC44_00525 [Planctomycetaceae bacterium]
MFETLLVLSVLLLVVVIGLYGENAVANLVVMGLAALASFVFLSFSTRTLMLIFPLLLATWMICRWRKVSRKRFAAFATLAVAAGWGIAMLLFIPQWQEIQRLAADHPVVRMDERLAYEHPPASRQTATAAPVGSKAAFVAAGDLMQRIDETVPLEPWARNHRRAALASLSRTHDDFVAAFVSQEGFGLGRMFHMPAKSDYIELQEPASLSLPRLPVDSPSDAVVDETRSAEDFDSYSAFHLDRTVDFVNPEGFGWSLDGNWEYYGRAGSTRVRGFQPHAFRDLPSGSPAGDEWQLARLELVSLLKHDPPAVYLSEHLPRMQELASNDAPTRTLNSFETAALSRLLDGETIVAEQGRNRITMLGGLRAAQQCLQCHSVGEGHLLGAFSYEFLRKEPLPPKDEKPTPQKPVT